MRQRRPQHAGTKIAAIAAIHARVYAGLHELRQVDGRERCAIIRPTLLFLLLTTLLQTQSAWVGLGLDSVDTGGPRSSKALPLHYGPCVDHLELLYSR